MFAPGDHIEARERAKYGFDVTLRCEGQDFRSLTLPGSDGSRAHRRRAAVADSGLPRGWSIAAFDRDGRWVAAYAERWIFAGHLWIGQLPMRLQIPIALRRWTVRADGKKVLKLDRAKDYGLVGAIKAVPASVDASLLVGSRSQSSGSASAFARPLKSIHVIEGRAETLEGLFDLASDSPGDDDGDGDAF